MDGRYKLLRIMHAWRNRVESAYEDIIHGILLPVSAHNSALHVTRNHTYRNKRALTHTDAPIHTHAQVRRHLLCPQV